MGRRRNHLPPFETEITGLGTKGLGLGHTPDGTPVLVRGAAPGTRVGVMPFKRKKGVWHGRKMALVRPAARGAVPRCEQFGLCGGCTLQELQLGAQREAKHEFGLAEVLTPMGLAPEDVRVHPIRGAENGFEYRNKVELSFGVKRYLSEADNAAGLPIAGRFLGFHAPGRFDRVVDAPRCELIDASMNALLATARRIALDEQGPAPWDTRAHTGFWRHLMLRQGQSTGQILVAVFTAPGDGEAAAWMERLAVALQETSLADGVELVGVVWSENDGVADVARGVVRHTWGQAHLMERLGQSVFRVQVESFFQTSTRGAEVLYDTIGEALGEQTDTLLDLYCGAGSIGLYLADQAEHIVGVEVIEAAVRDAEANAERNGVSNASYRVAKLEDALDVLHSRPERVAAVVDPPRAGLHPKVAKTLAKLDVDVLVYVACKPGSLGRDGAILQAGGWTMTDLWSVDLFPQTGHLEMVARFVRPRTS